MKTLLFLLVGLSLSLQPKVYDVIVIRADISGLQATQLLHERGISHLVHEASEHVGGRISPISFAGIQVGKGPA